MDIKLDLNLEQKLILTPQMRQSLEILQLNAAQLDEYIEKAIEENPVIERSEKKASPYSGDVPPDIPDSGRESLRDHLIDELLSSELRQELYMPARAVIEKVDDDGYITIPKSALAKELSLSMDELKEIFRAIYMMEPAGVGAYNLKQCLELQLRAKGRLTRFSADMIRDYLNDILANRLKQVAERTGEDICRVQEIADEIRALDPKPGRAYGAYDDNRYIAADLIIKEEEGRFAVYINDSYGLDIHVNEEYVKMYRENKGNAEIAEFLKSRIGAAAILAKAIEQRRKTLIKVAEAVAEEQAEFLRKGTLYLKPLTYEIIAEGAGVHKSTVSRAVKDKYVQTSQGTIPLRRFFDSGIGDSAAMAIKLRIRQMIDEEDKRKPLSDQVMAEKLNSQGMDISRRTVAKYRESIGILDSRRRRRYE